MNTLLSMVRLTSSRAHCRIVINTVWQTLAGLLAVVLLWGAPLKAQAAGNGGPQRATRAELQVLLADLEGRVAREKNGSTRLQLQLSVAAVKSRLELGDFKPGDRFVVALARDSAPVSDTALVRDSLLVLVAGLPELRLTRVLRSELDQTLQAHVSRYLKNVSARTTLLTRVQVSGPVGRAGFYYAAPDRPVSDLIMLAGGPGVGANLNSLRVLRGTIEVVSSKIGRRVIKDGRTLEQLDIQSGDEVIVGTARKINWGFVIQIFFIISSLAFAAISFLQWYYDRQQNQ